jgi:hypothetical protein
MPKEITVLAYTYDELTGKAKERAKNWYLEADFEWYQQVYEDARNVHVKIEGFDIDRGGHCSIRFINNPPDTLRQILKDHGEGCDTWKTAKAHEANVLRVWEGESTEEEADDVTRAFKKALQADYLRMLRDEYEYRNSDEYVQEMMQANGYTFDERGRIL